MEHEEQQDQEFRPLTEWQKDLVDRWAKMTPEGLIRQFETVRQMKDEQEKLLATLDWQYDYLRLKAIVQKFEDAGVTTMTLAGVGRVTLYGDLYARIPAAVRQEAYEWLRDNGHSSLITETVNAGTLKAAAKAMIKKGEQWPENLFKITPYSRAQLTPQK